MIKFDWDAKKARSNLRVHKVSFDEAQSVFYDDFAVQFFDETHSEEEDRFVMLGMSNTARVLVVVHCVREAGNLIRIVSARKATKDEKSFYRGPKS